LPPAPRKGTTIAAIARGHYPRGQRRDRAQLEAFAALLELNGASFYTPRAYRRAAELIRDTPGAGRGARGAGRVRELRGIGPGSRRGFASSSRRASSRSSGSCRRR
jgi:hypothetical protein